jgi:hypothetical protein
MPAALLKLDPLGLKLPSSVPSLFSAVTVLVVLFVTQTRLALSIATASGLLKSDPVGAKFRGIDQSFGVDASAGLNAADLLATS